MGYAFAESTNSSIKGRTARVFKVLVREFSFEKFVLQHNSIYITSTDCETTRQRARAFCIGYAVAKGWRKPTGD